MSKFQATIETLAARVANKTKNEGLWEEYTWHYLREEFPGQCEEFLGYVADRVLGFLHFGH